MLIVMVIITLVFWRFVLFLVTERKKIRKKKDFEFELIEKRTIKREFNYF